MNTQSSACFCLPRASITDVDHHILIPGRALGAQCGLGLDFTGSLQFQFFHSLYLLLPRSPKVHRRETIVSWFSLCPHTFELTHSLVDEHCFLGPHRYAWALQSPCGHCVLKIFHYKLCSQLAHMFSTTGGSQWCHSLWEKAVHTGWPLGQASCRWVALLTGALLSDLGWWHNVISSAWGFEGDPKRWWPLWWPPEHKFLLKKRRMRIRGGGKMPQCSQLWTAEI